MALVSCMVLSLILAGALAQASSQSDICFQDIPSYEAVKAQLPKTLQSYPLYAVNQSFELTGAFEIVANGTSLQIEAHVDPLIGDVINENAIITEACLEGTQLKVTLNTGESQTITVNKSSLTIEGYDFNITDLATYQKVAAKVPTN